jgi:hypothetical protein
MALQPDCSAPDAQCAGVCRRHDAPWRQRPAADRPHSPGVGVRPRIRSPTPAADLSRSSEPAYGISEPTDRAAGCRDPPQTRPLGRQLPAHQCRSRLHRVAGRSLVGADRPGLRPASRATSCHIDLRIIHLSTDHASSVDSRHDYHLQCIPACEALHTPAVIGSEADRERSNDACTRHPCYSEPRRSSSGCS